ncbi:GTP-binding protein [Bacillus lacus]|uniref:GTP-binding protein n=1 Tax=Metabacillus lacus TaxID=1983721 RepID=A0A7X2LZC0_9BACI|nr:GTP-binding protein [Metabacillus lacus]MRX73251.1 GTP-binding protein [Metabacillus lacus]
MKEMEIYILTGFLGSGKTTLLQKLLEKEKNRDRKVAVIMNELGSYSVDSKLLGKEATLRELLKGCICCTLKDEMENEILSLYQSSQPDVIYIEATGIAHPLEILDACTSPIIAPYVQIKAIYCVVDAARWLNRKLLNANIRLLLEEQVMYSSNIIINKIDIVTDDERTRVREEIAGKNPGAAILETTFSNGEFDEYGKPLCRPAAAEHTPAHAAHQLKMLTMTYQFSVELNKQAFLSWLSDLPGNVLRVKGFVRFHGEKSTYLIQYAYGIPVIEKMPLSLRDTIVIIGSNLQKDVHKIELKKLEKKSLDIRGNDRRI